MELRIKLVTEDGIGVQYVEPDKLEIEDDGTLTVVVRAWRGPEYELLTRENFGCVQFEAKE